ncbi:MAG: 23S rRNA (adenine(2503)-C(2))-methyltransferase RlmN [Eubacteriales bacterium]
MNQEIKTDLLSLTYEELSAFVRDQLGQPAFRAKQIADWLTVGAEFDDMSNLSKALREQLRSIAVLNYPIIAKKFVSQIDGTVKYLYALSDGQLIESVVMKYEHGYSICISSEAGCPMGCRFCASTIGGKVRNLLASEILGQVLVAQKDLGVRISNIVMMGIGEPLDNYDNTVRFLRLVSSEHSLNISPRHISLSTCGIVDKIYRLAEENLPITLSISLHASDDATRSEIMPVNNKWNIDQLLTACRAYYDRTSRRISFEYTLIAGKNDKKEQAISLARLLKRYMGSRPIHVNLIPVNPVEETDFKKSDRAGVKLFCDTLCQNGVNATVRRKLGSDIDASCGQLRHKEGVSLNKE